MSILNKLLILVISCVFVIGTITPVYAKSLPFAVLNYVNKKIPKKAAHYEFPSKKKPYIGETTDLNARIKQHLRRGKLAVKDLRHMRWTNAPQDKKIRKRLESSKIQVLDILTNGRIANIQHAPLSNARRKK